MAEKLKDQFFTLSSMQHLASSVRQVYADFDEGRFLALIDDGAWEERELKARMHHTARSLGETLPTSYTASLDILREVAPHIEGFEAMVFPDFVEIFGLHDWDQSMPALGYFTRFASAEFAVRPFLDQDPARAMAYMGRWAKDEDASVRRLASEGCRPRLPWAMALPKFKRDPRPIFPILEQLKDDDSESVRRSVANNLNDISKDNPDLVLEICEQWLGQSERTDWIVKHACRTLLKAGNERALRLFGFGDPAQIEVRQLRLQQEDLRIGDALFFGFELAVKGDEETKVRLEYAIDYVKARGKTSRKIFQISERGYAPGVYDLQRTQSVADMSTRTHYPGTHRLAIVVNGKEKAACSFELMAAQGSGE